MRTLLAILISLLVCVGSDARTRTRMYTPVAGAGNDADAQIYINAIISNGGTLSGTEQGYINTFVVSAKGGSNPYWTTIKLLNVIMGNALAGAEVQCSPGATLGSSTTSVASANGTAMGFSETGSTGGIIGDGSTSYWDTGLNSSGLTANSSGVAVYVGVANYFRDEIYIGSYNAGSYSPAIERSQASFSDYVGASGSPGTYTSTLTLNPTGKFFASNSTNGSSTINAYENGSAPSGYTSGTAAALPSFSIFVNALNLGGGGPYLPAQNYIRFYVVTAGMTAGQESQLYTNVLTLQTSLSRN